MKKGYLAKEAVCTRMSRAKGLFPLWIFALAAGAALLLAAKYVPMLTGFLSLVIAAELIAASAGTVFIIAGVFIEWLRPQPYGGLTVYAADVTREAAGQTIDAEAAQGKFLAEYCIRIVSGNKVKRTKRKIVLLPSYLLISSDIGTFTAIPADKIYWMCIQVVYRGGTPITKLKIFYDRKIQEIEDIEFLHTYHILEELYQHIPNVFYMYNPFSFCAELESLFYKDYDQFLNLYAQHKEAYQAQVQ